MNCLYFLKKSTLCYKSLQQLYLYEETRILLQHLHCFTKVYNAYGCIGSTKYLFFLENALEKTTEYFLKFHFFIGMYNPSG